LLNQL